jgi:hypothetical protein
MKILRTLAFAGIAFLVIRKVDSRSVRASALRWSNAPSNDVREKTERELASPGTSAPPLADPLPQALR